MKRYDIDYTDQSILDLIEIGNFIGLDNSSRADLFIEEITTFINEILSLFPASSNTRFPSYPNVRVMPYRRYNIYYQVVNDQVVEILHIHNSAKLSEFGTP